MGGQSSERAPAPDPKTYTFEPSPEFVEKLTSLPFTAAPLKKLLEGLEHYPFPGTAVLGVMPYWENSQSDNTFTAPLRCDEGDALVRFEVRDDLMVIYLIELVLVERLPQRK